MSDTWPSKAMNPITALTESGMPAVSSANRPPVIANGAVAMTASALPAAAHRGVKETEHQQDGHRHDQF